MKHLVAAVLLASSSPEAPRDEVVARANDAAITSGTLAARAAQAGAASAGQRAALLQDLVNDALLAQDAEKAGLAADPRVVAEVERARRKAAVDAFVEKELYPAAKVDDDMLRSMFHAQADNVTARVVTLTGEAAAKAAAERLRKGGKWADEAKAAADPAQRAAKGEPATLVRAQLEPDAEKALFSAPLKEVAGPVKLALGWAVIQVTAREIGDDKDFERRKESLRKFGEQQARGQVRGHYLTQLRKEAGAKLDEKFIESTGHRLEATPEELAHPVATLWGKPLPWSEVLPEVLSLSRGMTNGHFSGARVKTEVATQVLDRRLMEEAALRHGFGKTPEVERLAATARRDALARARAADLRAAAPKPTQDEVKAFYDANAKQFSRAAHRSCSHIVLESRAGVETAKKRLAAGERFEDVAKALSAERETAQHGGLIGEVFDDRLEAFAKENGEAELVNALRTAKPGEVAGPARSKMGFHLVRCGPVSPAAPAPLAEVAPAIQELLAKQKGDDAVRQRFAALRATAKVSIDEAALQRATSAK